MSRVKMRMKLIIIRSCHEAGITLIELMIVLALSSIIVEGLFNVYLQAKVNHANHYALQEITEETRFLERWFGSIIKGAGYLGLSSWDKISVYDNVHQAVLYKGIFLVEPSQLPENIQKKIKPKTQAIELRQMDFNVTSLARSVHVGETELIVEEGNSLHWKQEDALLIASNDFAEIVEIGSIQNLSNQKQLLKLSTPLRHSYEPMTYVGSYLDTIYFVGDTGKKFPDGQVVYGLYMFGENGMTEEMTDLVSDIQYQWLKGKTLAISVKLTVPHWVNGKNFSRRETFVITNRE